MVFCTPTRCEPGVLEWLQDGAKKEATAAEVLLAQKLTDTFTPLYIGKE